MPSESPAVASSRVRRARVGTTVRIVVAVRHVLDRDGLVAVLSTQRDFQILGCSADWPQTLKLTARLRPDVLLLDMQIEGSPGLPEIQELLRQSPSAHILVIAPHDLERCHLLNPLPDTKTNIQPSKVPQTNCLRMAIAQGALGAIRRSASREDLVSAVRTVAAGRLYLEPCELLSVASAAAPLTARERVIAAHVARGQSNKEISAELGIAAATVKKHITHIMRKLELHDRLQLALCVTRNPQYFLAHGANRPQPARAKQLS